MKTILIIFTLTFFSLSSGLIHAANMCGKNSDCDDGVFCNGVERCLPSDPSAGANGCVAQASSPCLIGEECIEVQNRCLNPCQDLDGDGAYGITARCVSGTDCDDRDRNRYPGNVEVCDAAGHDEDCDIATFGNRDSDGDGYIDSACFNLAD